jgi:hypothetical protein
MAWFSLLPSARTELATVAQPPPPGAQRRRVTFGVEIRADGAPVSGEPRANVGAEVFSAGDVVGFDPRMIARVDPPQGATGFEPNYMPFVEFVDADFPWRFSFEGTTGTRVKPWLVLIALKPDELEFLDQGNAPFARIRVSAPASSLPDLGQSWAFAHVHVAQSEQHTNDLAALIAARPDLHLSRLLCVRHLEPNTAYTLAVVPATEAGRLAGLGKADTPDPIDKPAWDSGTAAGLELPVYYQTRFVTSVLEDFELLARRLQPFDLDQNANVATPVVASAATPGYYVDYDKPDATFEVQDALMRADRSVQPYNTDPTLVARLETTLAEVIAGEDVASGDDGPDKEDPLVAMPPYGWRFKLQKTFDAARAADGSFIDRVNLDLKFRHSAGLGAETVRRNQEHYSRICWSQYRGIVAANLAIARLKAAQLLTQTMAVRHVEQLPADVVVALAEPLQELATLATGVTPAELLEQAGVPASYASRALRRVSSKRPERIDERRGGVERSRVMTPMPAIPGSAAVDRQAAARVPRPSLTDDSRQRIRALFGNDLILSGQAALPQPVIVNPVPVADAAGSVAATLIGLPRRKAIAVIGGVATAETDTLDTIMRSPIVSDTLVESLQQFEARAILRGVDTLPNNVVTIVKENRAFVEAFLVGANHEMNNELRWREFPTDMRGTIFRRFWDRQRPPDDPEGDDIPEIHTWDQPLGANYPAWDTDRKEALVLLIRGDLIRKYGMILAVLNHASGTTFTRGAGEDHPPVFAGRLGIDSCYFGFDVDRDVVLADNARFFFVLFEMPGRVRFGLDIATAAVRRSRFAYATAALRFPVTSLGRSAATLALPAHLKTGNPPPVQAATWDDLSWTHMVIDGAGYIDIDASSPSVAESPNYWSSSRDSASIARSFWQKPIAAVVPAARILA